MYICLEMLHGSTEHMNTFYRYIRFIHSNNNLLLLFNNFHFILFPMFVETYQLLIALKSWATNLTRQNERERFFFFFLNEMIEEEK